MTPHITILPAVGHLTLLKLLAAPPPIIAVLLTVPVETGKPKNVASNNAIDAAISVAKAWYFLRIAIPRPIVLMMLYPPIIVPNVMNTATGT